MVRCPCGVLLKFFSLCCDAMPCIHSSPGERDVVETEGEAEAGLAWASDHQP